MEISRRVDAAVTLPPAQVNAKRCLGNAWVARNDIPRAIRRYGAAVEIGDSDYDITDVAGREIVQSNGGRVEVVPFAKGYSTTGLVRRIRGYQG